MEFKDILKEINDELHGTSNIHIHLNQRKAKSYITEIHGLSNYVKELDIDKINKALKKSFHCSGTIKNDEDGNKILMLSGDQRTNVMEFLINEGLYTKEQIIIHGF
ncbi:Eukaryotic translation initiation factor SUI1 [Orpheovirus IHUMI-LCC2]|uniref:Eukaryotic translation initiation factor SUI1 n=1 Tax=Orpheovirus IHUMI-LCC2 TaxID=2023057 RepID=A0A2I2L4Q8_9VIRU|nr:Eukaryotic translation initiation factor SUI1 [Orpheovirus IHUMI-LCC2]SNW62528.1 Eukaryotic translation initiation factor SUI1 [Orpheovirus IHUMI-LCC2]